jgi:hypothetical protein
MKTLFVICFFLSAGVNCAQELYVSSEPASNMPAKSIGLRLNNETMPPYKNDASGINNPQPMSRINPEIMIGISKEVMIHFNMYASNFHQSNYKFEGAETYLKCRFLSLDRVHSHFRMAAYGKVSLINNPIQYNDINLQGDNSGGGGGLVATQLLHKLALSVTGGYARSVDNFTNELTASQPRGAYNYSFSAGYLALPLKYKSFTQPNFNLYVELLGKTNPGTNESYLDIAPAIQFIFKSRMRFDIAYKKQLSGNMLRINTQSIVLRFEYNIFNAYK